VTVATDRLRHARDSQSAVKVLFIQLRDLLLNQVTVFMNQRALHATLFRTTEGAQARTEADRGNRLIMTMPASTVLSNEYIEKEVRNLGRVFTRNTVNHHRFLLFAKSDREVRFSEGKVLVRIGRQQLIPTFTGNWKDQVMSERQITRNLKNRLWNLVEVKCTSIDRHTYCGEIMLPPLSRG
jgi:hypothetical protein